MLSGFHYHLLSIYQFTQNARRTSFWRTGGGFLYRDSLEEHLWHVASTTSTAASLRVARLGWLPSKTTKAFATLRLSMITIYKLQASFLFPESHVLSLYPWVSKCIDQSRCPATVTSGHSHPSILGAAAIVEYQAITNLSLGRRNVCNTIPASELTMQTLVQREHFAGPSWKYEGPRLFPLFEESLDAKHQAVHVGTLEFQYHLSTPWYETLLSASRFGRVPSWWTGRSPLWAGHNACEMVRKRGEHEKSHVEQLQNQLLFQIRQTIYFIFVQKCGPECQSTQAILKQIEHK